MDQLVTLVLARWLGIAVASMNATKTLNAIANARWSVNDHVREAGGSWSSSENVRRHQKAPVGAVPYQALIAERHRRIYGTAAVLVAEDATRTAVGYGNGSRQSPVA